jgi:hypothetical protein
MPGNKRGNKQYGRNAAKDKSTESNKSKKKGMARRKKGSDYMNCRTLLLK